MRVLPTGRAKVTQEALLSVLQSLLEAAAEETSRAKALIRMDEVASLCTDGAKVAAVIAMIGRRSLPEVGR